MPEPVAWVPPIARPPRVTCGKPCPKTHRGTECVRYAGHTGKHRDFRHPDCLMGHEMTLRGTTYTCSGSNGDHYAASLARDAFIAAGGCHGCEPPNRTVVGCPLHNPVVTVGSEVPDV